MKYLIYFLFVAGFIQTTFTSCKKDRVKGCTDPSAKNFNLSADEDDGSCVYPVANLSAKIDGVFMECDSDIRAKYDFVHIYGLRGTKENTCEFDLTFPGDLGIGSNAFLAVTPGSSFTNEAFVQINGTTYHSIDGNAIVTEYSDENIKGTFYFNAVNAGTADTVSVTDGNFNIDYKYQ